MLDEDRQLAGVPSLADLEEGRHQELLHGGGQGHPVSDQAAHQVTCAPLVTVQECLGHPFRERVEAPAWAAGPPRGGTRALQLEAVHVRPIELVAAADQLRRQLPLAHRPVGGLVVDPEALGRRRQVHPGVVHAHEPSHSKNYD